MHIFFVIVSIFLITRLIRLAFWRRRGWHGRHGCHGRGGWGTRRGPLGWVTRELGLDRQQRDIVETILHDVQRSGGDLRFGGRRLAREAAFAVAAPEGFDRTHLEDSATQQETAIAGLRARVIDGLERLSATLRPEQRDRLRVMAHNFWGADGPAGPPAPAAGPYRGSAVS